MIVSIKSEESKFSVPLPLFMGSILIRCIPKHYLNRQQKKIALKLFKALKNSLKSYKGLQVVEIISKDGECINIKI